MPAMVKGHCNMLETVGRRLLIGLDSQRGFSTMLQINWWEWAGERIRKKEASLGIRTAGETGYHL